MALPRNVFSSGIKPALPTDSERSLLSQPPEQHDVEIARVCACITYAMMARSAADAAYA
jgi:hypothetical protein